jgi:hypothetical protein
MTAAADAYDDTSGAMGPVVTSRHDRSTHGTSVHIDGDAARRIAAAAFEAHALRPFETPG